MAGLDLRASLSLDGAAFESGLNKIKGRLVQAFTAGAMIAYGKHLASTVGRIKDLAEQFNVTTDEMQRLDFAAKQNSLSFEDVGTALIRLGKARRDAGEGSAEMLKTFEKFGITLADINNPALRNVDLLNKIGEAIVTMNLSARDRTELSDLLGRVGEKLEVVLRDAQTLEGLEIITEDQINRIDQAEKSLSKLARSSENFLINILGTAAEKVSKFVEIAAAYTSLRRSGMTHEDAFAAMRADDAVQAGKASQDAAARIASKRTSNGPLFTAKGSESKFFEGDKSRSPMAGDSLVRVGNFLGNSRDSITRVGERTNQLLTQIERNTRRGSVTSHGSGDTIYE